MGYCIASAMYEFSTLCLQIKFLSQYLNQSIITSVFNFKHCNIFYYYPAIIELNCFNPWKIPKYANTAYSKNMILYFKTTT